MEAYPAYLSTESLQKIKQANVMAGPSLFVVVGQCSQEIDEYVYRDGLRDFDEIKFILPTAAIDRRSTSGILPKTVDPKDSHLSDDFEPCERVSLSPTLTTYARPNKKITDPNFYKELAKFIKGLK